MTKTWMPFDDTPIQTEQEWSTYARLFLASGVIPESTAFPNPLLVFADSTGMQVKVVGGAGFLQGHRFVSTATEVLPIATSDATNPRIDVVILRVDWALSPPMDIEIKQGAPAVTPAPPVLVQTDARYEILLGEVRVNAGVTTIASGNVADRRIFAQGGGFVAPPADPLVVNGGLEIWQRGNGPFTALGYCADRWLLSPGGGATVSVVRTTAYPDIDLGSGSALQCTVSSGTATLSQKVEDPSALWGRPVTVSLRYKQNAAARIALSLGNGAGVLYGPPAVISSGVTGSWQTLSYTGYVPPGHTPVFINISITGTGVFQIDNIACAIGGHAPFSPRMLSTDLAQCQRYYEVSSGYLDGYQVASTGVSIFVPFKVTKGGAPTLTRVGTWDTVNCGQPGVGLPTGANTNGFAFFTTVMATGAFQCRPGTTDDVITAEWNP